MATLVVVLFALLLATYCSIGGYAGNASIDKLTNRAAVLALILFLIIDPANNVQVVIEGKKIIQEGSYFSFFLNIMPSNFVQAFLENNVRLTTKYI